MPVILPFAEALDPLGLRPARTAISDFEFGIRFCEILIFSYCRLILETRSTSTRPKAAKEKAKPQNAVASYTFFTLNA
jgi:hypothetical protein